MALVEDEIVKLIKSVTGDVLQQQKQLDLQSFKIICKNYINAINIELNNLKVRASLMERVLAIGKFMHDDITGMQKILILSHAFENAFNNFLGRKIPITWVTSSGKIFIASEETTIDLYGSAQSAVRDSNTSGRIYTGKIKGIRQNMFNEEYLDPQLKQLQKQIDQSANNKRQIFQESKRRYNQSLNMEYAKQDKYKHMVQNIYWASDTKDGEPKDWSEKIASAGYIGEGYVAMVLNTAHNSVNTLISIPSKQPPYNPQAEKYIEILANYAAQGDAIPGIIQGDIKANESGSIQLAIKQGKSFSTASIAGNVAIAYAFLLTPQTELLSRQTIQSKLNKMGEEWKSASWKKIFEQISNQVVEGIQTMNPIMIQLT